MNCEMAVIMKEAKSSKFFIQEPKFRVNGF